MGDLRDLISRGTGQWQVSTGGRTAPLAGRWQELFYLSSDGKIMAAPVKIGANFDSSTRVALFQSTPRQPVIGYDLFVYDVSPDGQRFLINTPVKRAETTPKSIILNWPAKLNK